MGNYVKMLLDGFKVFVLFTGCTIIFYFGMTWINQEYEYYHRYDAPEKGAVKVSTEIYDEQKRGFWDRFVLFYLNGE